MNPHVRFNQRIVIATLVMTLAACAAKQVTQENSIEGKIAVHATRVVDANKAVTDAVKALAGAGTIPKEKAAEVVKIAIEIDTEAIRLADLLRAYDSASPGLTPVARDTKFEEIRQKVARIGSLLTTVLVPIADEGARAQIANLVGALNSTLLTLSAELAQGVR